MAVARWQATITDDAGAVVPSASVAVVSETTGGLATIYSDRAGTVSITNPTTADSDGFVAFYAAGDAYKITATSGSTTRQFRYVGIGTSQEEDKQLITVAESTFSGEVSVGFNGLDNYSKVVMEIERLQVATDTADLWGVISLDNGASYIQGTSNLFTLDRRTVATPALVGSTGTSVITLSQNLGTGTGEFYHSEITMFNHTDTSTYKYIHAEGGVYDATPDFRAANVEAMVTTGGSVTDFLIQASTGNVSGKVTLKGVPI